MIFRTKHEIVTAFVVQLLQRTEESLVKRLQLMARMGWQGQHNYEIFSGIIYCC
jgi:hypothetical protein